MKVLGTLLMTFLLKEKLPCKNYRHIIRKDQLVQNLAKNCLVDFLMILLKMVLEIPLMMLIDLNYKMKLRTLFHLTVFLLCHLT